MHIDSMQHTYTVCRTD